MKKYLSDIGEFKFIQALAKSVKTGPSVIKGIGDDCAVLKYKKNKHLLFTTDMIIEGVHFNIHKTPAASIGHKALAVNISDIAACGGVPKWAVVSAGIPGYIENSYAYDIYKGINNLACKYGIDLVGGDTNRSKCLILSIALLAEVKKEDLVLRSGAKENDAIVVTGPLRERPEHLRFTPKLAESRLIVKELMPSAMIDISDGLLSDLKHILELSSKGAFIYESLIPVTGKSASVKKNINIGEQFELLFSMPKNMLYLVPKGFYIIGEISGNHPVITFISKSGQRKKIKPKGYTHF